MNRAAIPAWEAAALVALTFAALVTVGVHWSAHGLAGTSLAELVCVIAPTVLFLRARRVPAAALGLAADGATAALPPWRAIAGGLFCGAGAFYLVAVALHAWIEHVWPTPPELREAMQRLVIPARGARPLAIDLLALALLPAAAEELLFRGVLWGAVRPRIGVTGAILVTAIAFGLYHGSIYRFAPAAFGGLLIGVVRAASGSLWAALAFHFANNAGVIVAMHLGYDTPPATAAPLAAAAVATTIGFVALARRR
ncbi:MAG: CPBP family intramembrane glutamic endopeptidase [Polyangia bacterium]